MNYRRRLGQWGEDLACEFLSRQGFTIKERNFHCQDGEADIIAQKDDEWWFVEVKTRRSVRCGEPEESVDENKIAKLEQTALRYLDAKEIEAAVWQLGLVSIKVVGARKVKIRFLII